MKPRSKPATCAGCDRGPEPRHTVGGPGGGCPALLRRLPISRASALHGRQHSGSSGDRQCQCRHTTYLHQFQALANRAAPVRDGRVLRVDDAGEVWTGERPRRWWRGLWGGVLCQPINCTCIKTYSGFLNETVWFNII